MIPSVLGVSDILDLFYLFQGSDILGVHIGYEILSMCWIWFACESLAMPWSLRSHSFPDGIYLGLMLDMRQFSCTGLGLLVSLSRCHGRGESLCFEDNLDVV